MTALRHAGERIGRYSLAKRQAVQQEDFITAKLRKEQIELYRRLVFEHLLVDKLLELDGVSVCVVVADVPKSCSLSEWLESTAHRRQRSGVHCVRPETGSASGAQLTGRGHRDAEHE